MPVLFPCLVLVLISAFFQPPAKALVTQADKNQVILAYNAAFDICKGITDSSRHDSKAAADDACDRAFKALDRIKLNTCHGWRNAGCRFARHGDQHRQCTCLISECDAYSVRSHVITPFQYCAPELWAQELATGELPAPTTNFKKRRIQNDGVVQTTTTFCTTNYSRNLNGSNGGSSSVYTTVGAGSSSGYGNTSAAYRSYSTGGSRAKVPRPYSCDECGVQTRSQRALFTHKRIHHPVCDTFCYICNEGFGNMRTFEAHFRCTHPEMTAEELGIDPTQAEVEAILPHCCQYCGKRYSSYNGLTDHLTSHTTDDTKCRVCHKILSTRQSLKNHMQNIHPNVPLIESGEDPDVPRFVCEVCGKSYAFIYGLRDHMKSHKTGETHCSHCNLTLSTKSIYTTHMKKKHPKIAALEAAAANQKYIEDNPEECTICKKRFRSKRGLRSHMDLHYGKTKCGECGSIFPRRAALNLHKRKEHS